MKIQMRQLPLLDDATLLRESLSPSIVPLKGQLLKWIGNKQRFATEIISYFPENFGTYFEPFLGSGAVLATLAPKKAVASDSFEPLIQIFQMLQKSPETLKEIYTERWNRLTNGDKKEVYEEVKASYNQRPNPSDLLFISRACYGGVVRFRKDGYISTPVGIHDPISPASFGRRVDEWHPRVKSTEFLHIEFEDAIKKAKPGDLIYCDPPYSYSQSILYGAQSFDLGNLLSVIADCKRRDIYVALSIDGTKRSGDMICDLPIPPGLFAREIFISLGHSMLKRFQMNGKTLENEKVHDRLLLTY
jgi:DNA adenine methylase